MRKEHERPLRVHPKALEEQLLLPLGRALLAAAATDGAVAGFRAFGPVRRLRCCEPLATLSLRPSGSGSVRRRSSRALDPESRRTRPPQPDPRPDGTGSRRAIRPSGRRAFRRSGYPPRRRVAAREPSRSSRARAHPPRPGRRRCVPGRGPRRRLRGAPRTGRGRAGGGGVGAEPDPGAGGAKRRQRCDAAAEERVRARAVRDRHVAGGEERDLGSSTSTQCAQRSSGQSTGSSASTGRLPGGRDEERCDLLERAASRGGATRSRSRSRRDASRPARRATGRTGRCRASRCTARAARSRSGRAASPRPGRASPATAPPRRPGRRRRPPGRRSRGAQVVRRGRRRPGEAVVGDGRHAGAQRLERAEPCDREHVLGAKASLARDVRPDPRAERQPVAEAGVVGVLEMRVRVHEARHDRRVGEVPVGAAGADLDDPSVLEADDAALDRRPVDREHPVRRYRRGHVPTGYVARRSARRSSSTEAQIDAS